MIKERTDKIKRSFDIEQHVQQRLLDIKEKKRVSASSVVNTALSMTVCLDEKTKERLIEVLDKQEIPLLTRKWADCGEGEVFWMDSYERQLQDIKGLVELLKL